MNLELENAQLKLKIIELSHALLQYQHTEVMAKLQELTKEKKEDDQPIGNDL